MYSQYAAQLQRQKFQYPQYTYNNLNNAGGASNAFNLNNALAASQTNKQFAQYGNAANNNFDYDYYDYGDYSMYPNQVIMNQAANNRNSALTRRIGGSNGLGGGLKSAASRYGSYSSSGYGCDNGISLGLLLTAALGIAVMFYTLFTKISMIGGRRRKRRSGFDDTDDISDNDTLEQDVDPFQFALTDIIWTGQYLFLELKELGD